MTATAHTSRPYRAELVWSALAALLAGGLAFVPLVNALGYEFAEVYCLFATVAAAAIALRRLADGSYRIGLDRVGRVAWGLTVRAASPLLLPLLIILLNALRVPNCDLDLGLLLYLLLPVATVPVVVAMAMAISVVVPRRRFLRGATYAALIVLSIVSSAGHLLSHPPIFAFHPTIGFFAGSVYDEALAVPAGLWPFRLMSLAFVAAVLSGIEVGVRRRRGEGLGAPLAVFLLSIAVWSGLYAERFELRMESDRVDIIEALGGVIESEHFIIYYPLSDARIAEHIDQVVADHEYRYARHAELFGVEPQTPLRSFIYANGSQKERLMGAGQTLIAKPWLGEMHITWRGVGEGAMSHELAHLFTRAFGSGPLRLAGPSLLSLDMGLVEGAAEAAAWDGDDLTFHGWAAALYRLDLAPELTEVIGATGFWGQYSRKVYTLMGSFSRWLIDEYGVDRYRRLYGSGDFEGIYQTPPEALVASWRRFLDDLPVSDAQLDLARFRYDRPPIFGKVCARSVAVRVQDSYELAAGHRYREAAECLEGVVDDDPGNLAYRLRWAELLREAGAYSRAEREARRVADAEASGPVLRARALELLGDVAWSMGDRTRAARFYVDASEAPLDSDALRMITVKLWGVRDEAVSDTVYALLLATPPPPHDGLTLMLSDGVERTGSPLLAYLLGFRLYNGFDYARAADYLERAVTGLASIGLGEVQPGLRAITRQGRLRLAQSQFLSGQIEAARAGFAHLAESGDVRVDALAASALDWVARCDWALARER